MLKCFILIYMIESFLMWPSSGWTAPKARWPSEWICYTNITRQNNNQPPDYGKKPMCLAIQLLISLFDISIVNILIRLLLCVDKFEHRYTNLFMVKSSTKCLT